MTAPGVPGPCLPRAGPPLGPTRGPERLQAGGPVHGSAAVGTREASSEGLIREASPLWELPHSPKCSDTKTVSDAQAAPNPIVRGKLGRTFILSPLCAHRCVSVKVDPVRRPLPDDRRAGPPHPGSACRRAEPLLPLSPKASLKPSLETKKKGVGCGRHQMRFPQIRGKGKRPTIHAGVGGMQRQVWGGAGTQRLSKLARTTAPTPRPRAAGRAPSPNVRRFSSRETSQGLGGTIRVGSGSQGNPSLSLAPGKGPHVPPPHSTLFRASQNPSGHLGHRVPVNWATQGRGLSGH